MSLLFLSIHTKPTFQTHLGSLPLWVPPLSLQPTAISPTTNRLGYWPMGHVFRMLSHNVITRLAQNIYHIPHTVFRCICAISPISTATLRGDDSCLVSWWYVITPTISLKWPPFWSVSNNSFFLLPLLYSVLLVSDSWDCRQCKVQLQSWMWLPYKRLPANQYHLHHCERSVPTWR